jgi:hypothetical protein
MKEKKICEKACVLIRKKYDISKLKDLKFGQIKNLLSLII